MLDRLFLHHPRSVGESYWGHQKVALRFAWRLSAAAGACVLHALVPALFPATGSAAVARLHSEMSSRHAPDARG